MNLLDLARKRKSVRKYLDRPVEAEKIEALSEVARRAREAYNACDAALVIADDPILKEKLKSAIVSGWQGKINLWLYTSAFPAAMVLLGRSGGSAEEIRPLFLPPACMMLETVILAAAEMGLGTCWMAGFNPAAVRKVLQLPPEWQPIIVSPLGYSAQKEVVGLISRTMVQADRRKPIAEIHEMRGKLA